MWARDELPTCVHLAHKLDIIYTSSLDPSHGALRWGGVLGFGVRATHLCNLQRLPPPQLYSLDRTLHERASCTYTYYMARLYNHPLRAGAILIPLFHLTCPICIFMRLAHFISTQLLTKFTLEEQLGLLCRKLNYKISATQSSAHTHTHRRYTLMGWKLPVKWFLSTLNNNIIDQMNFFLLSLLWISTIHFTYNQIKC